MGESAKIPKLRDMMKELFQKELNDSATETAVVTGAACQVLGRQN